MQTQIDFQSVESQKGAILKALLQGEKLTALDCLHRFGSMQAATRIFELRQVGHPIASTFIRTRSGKRVVQYSLNHNTKNGQKITA